MDSTSAKLLVLRLGALAVVGYAGSVAFSPAIVHAKTCCNSQSGCAGETGTYCNYDFPCDITAGSCVANC